MANPLRPVRFGIQLAQEGVDFGPLLEHAQEAERLGFTSAWVTDHLIPPVARGAMQGECWTTLTAMACGTKTLRVGPLVLCASFRPPALVASAAATLDRIANGRLDLGIGAGWFEAEYKAAGYDFPPTRERIARLDDALSLIKTVWTEAPATYQGQYARVENWSGVPRPLQQPHPPIWVGGNGEKYTLRVVAKQADVWNMSALLTGTTPEETARKIALLDDYCREIGRDPATIAKSWFGLVMVDEDEARLNGRLERLAARFQQPVEQFAARRLVGTPEQVVAKVQALVDVGLTYFVGQFGRVGDLEPTRLFGERVIARFAG